MALIPRPELNRRLIRAIAKLFMVLTATRVHVTGLDNLPHEPHVAAHLLAVPFTADPQTDAEMNEFVTELPNALNARILNYEDGCEIDGGSETSVDRLGLQ